MTLWTNQQPLIGYTARAEHALFRFLPKKEANPAYLHEAMHYAVFNGGKRLRPLLVYATGAMLQVPLSLLDKIAAAIEFLHCYSLVHDDLPAMDNADLRRGKPSTHKAFDEATAILVGDALQSLAFETLSSISEAELAPKNTLELSRVLAKSVGSFGMAGGQMLDLHPSQPTLSQDLLTELHEMKTGKLLQACIEMPIICANIQDLSVATRLQDAAKKLGLAFQVQDDLLDHLSNTEQLGKPQGQDQQANKCTFATVMPLTQAITLVDSLYQSIINSVRSFDFDVTDFCSLIEGMANRQH